MGPEATLSAERPIEPDLTDAQIAELAGDLAILEAELRAELERDSDTADIVDLDTLKGAFHAWTPCSSDGSGPAPVSVFVSVARSAKVACDEEYGECRLCGDHRLPSPEGSARGAAASRAPKRPSGGGGGVRCVRRNRRGRHGRRRTYEAWSEAGDWERLTGADQWQRGRIRYYHEELILEQLENLNRLSEGDIERPSIISIPASQPGRFDRPGAL